MSREGQTEAGKEEGSYTESVRMQAGPLITVELPVGKNVAKGVEEARSKGEE
jgi:hypothetical protein